MQRHTDEYLTYLKSEHWRKLRRAAYRKAGRCCEACGRGGMLHGHHLIYRTPLNAGILDDILVLCFGCHRSWHRWLDTSGQFPSSFDRLATVEMLRFLRPPKFKKKQKGKKQKRHRRPPKVKQPSPRRQIYLDCRAIELKRARIRDAEAARMLARNKARYA